MLDKIFDHKEIEQKHYQTWEESGVFHANPASGKDPFAIMIPPPNVTGSLHIGHAFTMTLQDLVTRYHRMKGRDALWLPGTDHAGIATQMVVERKLAAEKLPSRREMGRAAFLEKVWEWKGQSGGTITSQLRKLGASLDWSRERFTMDEGLNRAVRKVFVELYREGLIYRDNRLVNWDPKLLTAVSDIEVVAKEVKGHMWYIRYPIEGDQERFITIATTRPETMLGDSAVVVHPDDERYKDLIGKFAVLPLVGRLIKIIGDEYVDPELGTGAMKVTPAHDFNDFEIGRRHGLEMINIMDIHARMNDKVPEEYQGLDRFDARKKVLNELEALDLLEKIEDITHTVPYGDRSDVVIEPFLTVQWYCDAKTLAGPAIRAVEDGRTKFVPDNWKNTYCEWLNNIQPWCISRQLWWGHQIPAWYDEDGVVYVAETEEEAQAQAGVGVKLRRDEDVLDTWFSSALWPFSTLGWPDQTADLKAYYPGSLLITGFDILFFWVARMMMMGLHFMKDVPFHTVYLHALVRDAKGQKMSKSKGNVIDPLDVIAKYGTDSLRFCLISMAAQGRDIRLSDERIEGYRNFATKIWNATRYCEMNGCLPQDSFNPAYVRGTVNRWIISQVLETQKSIDQNMGEYRFNDAALAIYQFVWGTFCDWYLEFTKPLLSDQNDDETLKAETRATTGWVLDQILVLLNPFMPFISEELYAKIAQRAPGTLVMAQAWPDYDPELYNSDSVAELNWLIKLISEVRSVRADMNVPASAKIAMRIKDASAQTLDRVEKYREIILRMARLDSIAEITAPPKGSLQTVVDEATIILPIAEIIDLDKERARLRKEIDKLSANIDRIDQKLADQKFMDNAPQEIVDEQRSRRAETELILKKLSQALQQLEAA